MTCKEILTEITVRLGKKNIHELRQIARAVGVVHPAEGKKERLENDILAIARCEISPAPRSARGAPPKSSEYDRELVALIERCMSLYSSAANGTGVPTDEWNISDGSAGVPCEGVLVSSGKIYKLLGAGSLSPAVFVHDSFINRFSLAEGDYIRGSCTVKSEGAAPGLVSVSEVNGFRPDALRRIPPENLIPVYPSRRLSLYSSASDVTARIIDMFAPVGRGQRGVIYISAEADPTELILQIARGISLNEGISVSVFLPEARPEDVTLFTRSLGGVSLFFSPFGAEPENKEKTLSAVCKYLRAQTCCGADSALVLFSYDLSAVKTLLSCAVCTENGGSSTVVAVVPRPAAECAEISAAANMCAAVYGDEISTYVDISACRTLKSPLIQTDEEQRAAANLKSIFGRDGVRLAGEFKKYAENSDIIGKYKNG